MSNQHNAAPSRRDYAGTAFLNLLAARWSEDKQDVSLHLSMATDDLCAAQHPDLAQQAVKVMRGMEPIASLDPIIDGLRKAYGLHGFKPKERSNA